MNQGQFLTFMNSDRMDNIPGISAIRYPLKHIYTYKMRKWYRNRVCFKKFHSSKTRKDKKLIKSEINRYKKHWKVYPFPYYLFELYERKNTFNEEDNLNYIPSYYWNHRFIPRMNNPKFITLFDKITLSDLFKSLNLSTPEVFLKIRNGTIYDDSYNTLSDLDIEKMINEITVDKIFIKPSLFSAGGSGITVFKKNGNNYYDQMNFELNVDYLRDLSKCGNFIAQIGIKQHQTLSDIYPNSINTLRVVTFKKENECKIIAALLRMGQGDMDIDNASSGGLTTNVDLNSFETEGNVYIFPQFIPDTSLSHLGNKHPTTGVDLVKISLPFKEEIKTLVKKGSALLSEMRVIGWDIAISQNGPIIVEANNGCCIIHLQGSVGKGMNDQFQILK